MRIIIQALLVFHCLAVVLMNGRFRCGANPCQRSFNSSRGVTLHRSTCVHYEAYVSRPRLKRRNSPTPGQLSKRPCREENRHAAQTTNLESTPSPSDPSGANDGAAEVLSTAISPSHLAQRTEPETTEPVMNVGDQLMVTPHLAQDTVPATELEVQFASSDSPNASGSRRPARGRRLPARFRDVIPEAPPPVVFELPPLPPLPHVILHVFDSFRTAFNAWGIAREYRHQPSCDPDSFLSLEELSNKPSHASIVEPQRDFAGPPLPPWPWKSMSIWRLMSWMLSGGQQKSVAEVTCLASTVLTAEDFCPDDLVAFNARTELHRFDASEKQLDPNNLFRKDGWSESSVTISVPTRERNPTGNGADFAIPGFLHRNLMAVVRAAFSDPGSKWFHFTPFKQIWRPLSSGEEQGIYDEYIRCVDQSSR